MAKKTPDSRREMARPRTYASGRNITIGDRAGLAQLIGEVISSRFKGSVARAARETGTSRALLRRIMAGTQLSIRTDNVQALRQLAQQRFREVESMLIAGRARERLEAFDEWLQASLNAAHHGIGALDGTPVDPLRARNYKRLVAFYTLSVRLRRDYASEWKPLFRAVTRRHYHARALLAFARVVAPLLDSAETGGVERAAEEFSDAEIRAFIKAGVTRERLLLNRSNDVDRAHTAPEAKRVSGRPPAGTLPGFDWLLSPADIQGDLTTRDDDFE